jgi:hypothetical protein
MGKETRQARGIKGNRKGNVRRGRKSFYLLL